MTFREYQPGDREACLKIFWSNMPRFFDASELAGLEKWLNGRDAGRLAYGQTQEEYYYVVEEEGKVIGSGGFYIPREGKYANMTWGMVDNALHRKGIGRGLLLFRIEMIRKLFPGYSIRLDTTQHSYRFFEKMGFEVVMITKDGYGEGLDRYDMVSA